MNVLSNSSKQPKEHSPLANTKEQLIDVKGVIHGSRNSLQIRNVVLLVELLIATINEEWPTADKDTVAVLQGKVQFAKDLLKILNGEDASVRYRDSIKTR